MPDEIEPVQIEICLNPTELAIVIHCLKTYCNETLNKNNIEPYQSVLVRLLTYEVDYHKYK